MISSVSHKVGKTTIKLKFSTQALVRLEEEHDGRPFHGLLEDLLTGKGGVRLVVAVLAATMKDGAGVDQKEAWDLIDRAGGYRKLVPSLSKAVDAAFPEVQSALDDAAAKAEAAQLDAEETAKGKAQDPASA